jgi:hypothetical protein
MISRPADFAGTEDGLGRYAQRFAENDISFAVLPDLTDQHLKGIGVSLRLQTAVAYLTWRGTTPISNTDTHSFC